MYGSFTGAALGIGAPTNGALAFPASNPWNADISTAAVDPNSAIIIASIGTATGLHADLGAGLYNGGPIGNPYVTVAGTQSRVAITFTAFAAESDPRSIPGATQCAG